MQTPTLSEDAVELLAARDWPGNVRELEHCLERTLILGRSGVIRPEDVALDAGPPAADPVGGFPLDEGLHAAVARLERGMIERALAASGGNRTRAAEILKINRRLLYDKLREYGLD
jgi:DNA-binding NtrC family response regulator